MNPSDKAPIFNIVTRKRIIVASLCLLLVILVRWFYLQSYIEITVTNNQSDDIGYQITSSDDGKKTEVTSNSTTLKKQVNRGSYQVMVSNDKGSYFTPAKTGGFFSTTHIKADLKPEKTREFVGNDPDPCMYYDGETLYSYGCGSPFNELKVHRAATSSLPTYADNPTDSLAYPIIGLIKSGGNKVLLYNDSPNSEEGSKLGQQMLFSLNENLTVSDKTITGATDPEVNYQFNKYGNDYLFYDSNFKKSFVYSPSYSKAKSLDIPKTSDKSLKPVEISMYNDTFSAAYTNKEDDSDTVQNEENTPDQNQGAAAGKTEVYLFKNSSGEPKKFKLRDSAYSVKLCGQNRLCALSGRTLSVYDISGNKASRLYQVSDVRAWAVNGDGVAAVTTDGVIGFNSDKGTGSFTYKLDSYRSCGINNTEGTGYVLCVIDSHNNRSALYINPNEDSAFNIDKVITSMEDESYIEHISVYKNYVYISPDLGEQVFSDTTGGYDYDPVTKAKTNAKISQLIADSGLVEAGYTVINTSP